VDTPYWTKCISDVLTGRVTKPRISGLTMVIDTGLPVNMMRDILHMASDHIDYWKLGFASACVCPVERIMDKITLCQEYGVLAYPGGTLLEIAYVQNRWRDYLESLYDSGVRVVEVSDGTVEIPQKARREMIRTASKRGFTVLSEVGKKQPGAFIPIAEQLQIIHSDLNSGASYIIVEGREAGRNVGVYDANGNVKSADVQALLDVLGPLSTRIIWEAPETSQQLHYITTLGNRVNLGNVKPLDVIALESLRRGLRSDTLRTVYGPKESEEELKRDAGNAPSQAFDVLAKRQHVKADISRPRLWVDGAHVSFQGKKPKPLE
jgi:phosphosulfolactate synthase